MMVKICGITNVEDAQLALDAGARALGFNFYNRSPRFITPAKARAIVEALEGEYLRVGVFVNASATDLRYAEEEACLDVVQLHGSPAEGMAPAWRAIAAGTPPEMDSRYAAYLIDTPCDDFGGSGHTFDWTLAAAFPFRKIIAGGLDSSNVAAAIHATSPWGVDACSRLESNPGKKDPKRVRDFVAAALAAASS